MTAEIFRPIVLAICSLVVAVVLIYDTRQAVTQSPPGERVWRYGRIAGTAATIRGLSVLERAIGTLWAKPRATLLGVFLGVGPVRSLIPMARIVREAVHDHGNRHLP